MQPESQSSMPFCTVELIMQPSLIKQPTAVCCLHSTALTCDLLVHQATAGPLNWAWTAWAQSGPDKQDDIDISREDAQDQNLRDMTLAPAEQSGYPSHTFDEDRPSSGEAEKDEQGPAGSSCGGSGSSHTENDQPVDGVNMQSGDHKAFLAAVKKQSKVKEGAWSEVRQQSDEHDLGDGTIEID